MPKCESCGKPVDLLKSHREDPRGSGNFFHMHGCFNKFIQEGPGARLKDRSVEASPNTSSQIAAKDQKHLALTIPKSQKK